MRRLITILCFSIISQLSWAADKPGQFPAGIVYGPKAAFQISAPTGWVLDNYSGLADGLHCVLYPEGQTWAESPILMYAKIASPDYPNRHDFIKFAIDYFKKEDPKFSYRIIRHSKTSEGFDYTVNEYDRPLYPHYERVIYIQLPDVVAYVVYNADDPKDRLKYSKAFEEVINSFRYRPDQIKK